VGVVRAPDALDELRGNPVLRTTPLATLDVRLAGLLVERPLDQPESARSQHTPHLPDRTPLLVLFEQLVEGRPETDDGVERLRSIRQARHRTDGQADAELFGIGRPTRRLDQVLGEIKPLDLEARALAAT